MKTFPKHLVSTGALFGIALAPSAANACAVCMGGSDSTVAPAANGAIFCMIAVIGTVLAALAGFIFHLARRAKLSPVESTPELAAALSIISEEKQHA